MKKPLLKIAIIIVVIFILLGLASCFLPFLSGPGMIGSIFGGLSGVFDGSQTVGQVTVNRRAGKIKIETVSQPTWDQNSLSPIIGQAYHITKLTKDNQPARVEIAYNPAELKEGIDESVLSLYKWHDEGGQKFWQQLPSEVDTERHVVSAELKTFSIVGVRAPLAYYVSPEAVNALNSYLNKLMSYIPPYSCGVFIIVDEELQEWKDGELVDAYYRPSEETTEALGCAKNPKAPFSVLSDFSGYEREVTWNLRQERLLQYNIHLTVGWQIDNEESAEVSGMVKDQDGNPLANVLVIAEKQTFSPWVNGVITDEEGNYKIKLPSGDYKFTINPSGPGGGNGGDGDSGDGNNADNNSGDNQNPESGNGRRPDKVVILAQGSLLPNPPKKSAPSDPKKNKNCQKDVWRQTLHVFGDLPKSSDDPVTIHDPWKQDFTLTCAKYYINDTVTLPINADVGITTLTGSETNEVVGRQTKVAKGGYGWEGKWEVEHTMDAKTKVGTFNLGQVTLGDASNSIKSHDFYTYEFSLPPKPVEGYTFQFIAHRPEGGYWDEATLGSGGTTRMTVMGEQMQVAHGQVGSRETAQAMDMPKEGKIIKVMGEEGAILEFTGFMSTEPVRVYIKKNK